MVAILVLIVGVYAVGLVVGLAIWVIPDLRQDRLPYSEESVFTDGPLTCPMHRAPEPEQASSVAACFFVG